MSQFKKFARTAGLLFVIASAVAFLLYFGMKALSGRSPIIVMIPFRPIIPYYDRHPVPYLLVIAFIFAVVSALWLTFILPRFTRFRFLQIVALPWIALMLASSVWGMLWAYHDMQAGFFPPFPQMIDYLLFGAQAGLYFALDSALFSAPMNLLAYGAACLLLMIFVKRSEPEQPECNRMRSM
jgi:hypothetical protein